MKIFKKIISFMIVLTLCQPFIFAEVNAESIGQEFKDYGFDVPNINIVYVESFNVSNVRAVYYNGTITMIDDEQSLRVARHEVAHAVSLELIKSNVESFNTYRITRLDGIKIKTKFYNVTANQLSYIIKVLKWYYNITKVEEIVAEDIYYMIYGLDVQQKDYIGNPTTNELSQLKLLLKLSNE